MQNHLRSGVPRALAAAVLAFVALTLAPAALAQDNNACDMPGEAPDVIVADIYEIAKYGTVGDISVWAIGTISCNVGTCEAQWISGTPEHPVIGQNLFRLKEGRIEHIGQAWLKHGFATLNGGLCGACLPTDGSTLGVNCSDPYSAGLNAEQGNMGPKYQVDPSKGVHDHPFDTQGQTGNAIYKRLQIHHDDLDAALNPGAQYYVESQYLAADDAGAVNNICGAEETPGCNNSVRKVAVSGSDGAYTLSLSGPTIRERAAIVLWSEQNPDVLLKAVFTDGMILAGSKATDVGGGVYEYEYAVQNVTSRRAVRSVSVTIPTGAAITNVGFHDVEYHSDSPVSNEAWEVTVAGGTLEWATETFAENEWANAIRWGTLYNFRFRTNVPPVNGSLTMGMFLAGGVDAVGVDALVPDPAGVGLGTAGQIPNGADVPGEPMVMAKEANGDVTLIWDHSCVANNSLYGVYEGPIGGEFDTYGSLFCDLPPTSTTFAPSSGSVFYLVVPSSDVDEEGSYGLRTDGIRSQGSPACHPWGVASCE